MKKKFNSKYLIGALISLIMFFVFHYISTISVFGNGLKIIAIVAFIINIALTFNIKIPGFSGKK